MTYRSPNPDLTHLLQISRPFTLLYAFFLLTFSCAAPSAFGQSATATLSGTVEDVNGAVIPSARVTVTNKATGQKRDTTTNDQGYFTVPLLPPSTYVVLAEHEGFARIETRDIVLNVGDQKNLRIELKTGDIKETVVVEGGAPLINESPAVGTVVDRQFVENIPLNGRSFQSLIASVPGVVAVPGASTGVQGEFSVNGQRTESNYYTVDGVAANTGSNVSIGAFSASGSIPSESALGTTQSLVSLDALQEFRIQTSTYSAEYGRTPGGQISFATRSGNNAWHGSAFDYLRNGVLDANNWFNNANRLPKTSERQNDFGGTLGGPIMLPRFGEGGHQPWYNGHNRTFFFFSYEGLRVSTPVAARITFVPDLCLRGTAGQCTGGDAPGAAPLQPFLNAFPIPNGPKVLNAQGQTTGMAQFVAAYSAPGTLDAASIRVDHSFNSKFAIFGYFSDSPSKTISRGTGIPSFATLTNTTLTVKKVTFGATNLVNSRLTNDVRFNYSWNDGRIQFTLDNFGGAQPFDLKNVRDVNGQATPGIYSMNVLLLFGGNAAVVVGNPRTSGERQINLVDTLSYSMGGHHLKFGGDFRQLTTRLSLATLQSNPVFSSKTQVQQNLVSASSSVSAETSIPIAPVYKNLSVFAQDEWKLAHRLSLSLGLRWELNPPPSDGYGNTPYTLDQITNLATSKVAPKGTPLWKTTYGNLAPRLGLAYQLRSSPGRETVIRGGFGVFYDLGNTYASEGYGGVGIGSRTTLNNVPFPFTSTQLTLPPPSINSPYNTGVFAFDPQLKLPYTLEWSAAIEQALGKNQVVTINYVGAASRRLLWKHFVIPAMSGNPNFTSSGSLALILNGATSDYDAMQVQYQRRLSGGLQASASYTWAHSIDETSTNGTSQQLVRASSNFDIRHNVQASVTYDIPGKYDNRFAGAILRHWSLDTRISGRSALPFDVTSGTFIDSAGIQEQLRADLVPGQPIYVYDSQYPGGRVVNFNAFTVPTAAEKAARQFGNAPRNLLRGFPAWQMDFAIRREFAIHERLTLQFRAEAFNIFNHPIFGAIQTNLTTGLSLFGRATGTLNNQLGGLNALYQVGGPRSLQFALRLQF